MEEHKKSEAFYQKLKVQLYDTAEWPSQYLFKFIVETKGDAIKNIEALFDNMGAVIKTKESSKGKYTSVYLNIKKLQKTLKALLVFSFFLYFAQTQNYVS